MKAPNWTPDEISILRNNYSSKSIFEISNMIGRSWGSTAQKAFKLGITDHTMGKIQWSNEDILFLKNNFQSMTSYQLAAALNKKRTIVRMKYKELGLKKMELEKWPGPAVKFLRKNYKVIGDVEIAEILDQLFPKKKGWDKRHVCKKRRQLGLYRTSDQIQKITQKHLAPGGRQNTIRKNSCSLNMSDIWVAGRIAWRNPVLAREIVKNHPELIKIKRNQILLNRELKKCKA